MPSFTSLKPAIFHCRVQSFLSMLSSLSLAKVRRSLTLTLSSLIVWYSGLRALLLFLLTKAALAYLSTVLSMALRPLFPFQQAQFVEVFLLKPVPFCMLFAGLGSTNKSVISFLFFLSDSCVVLTTLSSPPSFLLPQILWQIWQERSSLSFCTISLQWVPGCSFLWGNNVADELARPGALLASSAIPYNLSSLISPIDSCLFSDGRRIVSSKFFDTQVPSISTENLCSLVTLAVCSLVCAATDTAYC